MARPLNPRQLRFVELFLAGNTGTEAYARAYGCTRAAAKGSAPRLLADERVQQLLQPARQEQLRGIDIARDRVRLEMARLAFVSVKDLFTPDGRLKPVGELDADTAAAVAQFDVEEKVKPAEGDRPA